MEKCPEGQDLGISGVVPIETSEFPIKASGRSLGAGRRGWMNDKAMAGQRRHREVVGKRNLRSHRCSGLRSRLELTTREM